MNVNNFLKIIKKGESIMQQSENRPLYVRLNSEERAQFDKYCNEINVNYSIVVRAMVKDCLARIAKGETIDLTTGLTRLGRPTKAE
jgi:hypothetical protein